jgi:hypothetical protein
VANGKSLMCALSPSEVEIAVVKMKNYKLPGSDKIPADLIETGGETLLGFRNSLILFGIRKSIVVAIYKKGDKTECIIIMQCAFNFIQNCIQYHSLMVKSMYW